MSRSCSTSDSCSGSDTEGCDHLAFLQQPSIVHHDTPSQHFMAIPSKAPTSTAPCKADNPNIEVQVHDHLPNSCASDEDNSLNNGTAPTGSQLLHNGNYQTLQHNSSTNSNPHSLSQTNTSQNRSELSSLRYHNVAVVQSRSCSLPTAGTTSHISNELCEPVAKSPLSSPSPIHDGTESILKPAAKTMHPSSQVHPAPSIKQQTQYCFQPSNRLATSHCDNLRQPVTRCVSNRLSPRNHIGQPVSFHQATALMSGNKAIETHQANQSSANAETPTSLSYPKPFITAPPPHTNVSTLSQTPLQDHQYTSQNNTTNQPHHHHQVKQEHRPSLFNGEQQQQQNRQQLSTTLHSQRQLHSTHQHKGLPSTQINDSHLSITGPKPMSLSRTSLSPGVYVGVFAKKDDQYKDFAPRHLRMYIARGEQGMPYGYATDDLLGTYAVCAFLVHTVPSTYQLFLFRFGSSRTTEMTVQVLNDHELHGFSLSSMSADKTVVKFVKEMDFRPLGHGAPKPPSMHPIVKNLLCLDATALAKLVEGHGYRELAMIVQQQRLSFHTLLCCPPAELTVQLGIPSLYVPDCISVIRCLLRTRQHVAEDSAPSPLARYNVPYWDRVFCACYGINNLLDQPLVGLAAFLDLDVATQKDLLAAPLPRNSIHPSSGAIASLRLLTTIDWSNKHDACVRTVSEEIQVSASRLKLRHLVTISEDILTRLGLLPAVQALLDFGSEYITYLRTSSSSMNYETARKLLSEGCQFDRLYDVYTSLAWCPSLARDTAHLNDMIEIVSDSVLAVLLKRHQEIGAQHVNASSSLVELSSSLVIHHSHSRHLRKPKEYGVRGEDSSCGQPNNKRNHARESRSVVEGIPRSHNVVNLTQQNKKRHGHFHAERAGSSPVISSASFSINASPELDIDQTVHQRPFAKYIKRCAMAFAFVTLVLWSLTIAQMTSLMSQRQLEHGSITSIYSAPTLSLASILCLFFLITAFRYWERFIWQRGILQFLWDTSRFVCGFLAFINFVYVSYRTANNLVEDHYPMDVVHIALFVFRTVVLFGLALVNHLALNSTTRERSLQSRPLTRLATSHHVTSTEHTLLLSQRNPNHFQYGAVSGHGLSFDCTPQNIHASNTSSGGSGPWTSDVRLPQSDNFLTSASEVYIDLAGRQVSTTVSEVRGWVPPWAGAHLSSWLVMFTLGSQMEYTYFIMAESDLSGHPEWIYLGCCWFVDLLFLYVFLRGALAWDDWGFSSWWHSIQRSTVDATRHTDTRSKSLPIHDDVVKASASSTNLEEPRWMSGPHFDKASVLQSGNFAIDSSRANSHSNEIFEKLGGHGCNDGYASTELSSHCKENDYQKESMEESQTVSRIGDAKRSRTKRKKRRDCNTYLPSNDDTRFYSSSED